VNKKEILSDNTGITANSKQLAILKQNFPNCFDKNGAFIPHKMMEIVGKSDLDLSRESYSLNWLGKSYARLLANENPQTLLKEDKEYNAKEANKNSQNILIQGDNLEVLKHLKNAYSEKIKMIYIDPPYNTGNDGFVYNDDRKFTTYQLAKLAGIEEGEAKRILEFTQSKSNSHSAWLTFMYPRLYVARELLREDGVIFISIDDNEQAQLKMVCDEVFGEENFFATLTRRAMHTVRNTSKDFNKNADYILVYAKSKSWFESSPLNFIRQIVDKTDNYTLNDNDGRGTYKLDPLYARNYASPYRHVFKNGIAWQAPNGSYPRYAIDTLISMEQDNRIVFTGKEPKAKRYLAEVQEGQPPNVILSPEDVGFNSHGTSDLYEILGADKIFTQPKPIKLIKFLMFLLRDKNGFILDFFAGSGTTAHAVMALNAQDGGNRRFITVQIDEPTDPKSEARKAGYETIFDITKARIEKAAAKIKKDETLVSPETDTGFKIFQTVPLFEGYLDEIDDLDDGLELYDGSRLNEEELGCLLTTWKTYDGIALTEDLHPINFANYQAYTYEKNVYLMDKNFTSEALRALIKALDEDPTFQPSKLVLFGYNFQSKFLRETAEGLKSYKNKKSIELDVVARY